MATLIGGFSENQYRVYLNVAQRNSSSSHHWVAHVTFAASRIELAINRCVYCLLHDFSFPNNALLLKKFERHVFKEKMTEQETAVAMRILQQFQKCKDLDSEMMEKIAQKLTKMEQAFHPHPDPLPVVMDPTEEDEGEPSTEQPVHTAIENTDDSKVLQEETQVDCPPGSPPSPSANQSHPVIEEEWDLQTFFNLEIEESDHSKRRKRASSVDNSDPQGSQQVEIHEKEEEEVIPETKRIKLSTAEEDKRDDEESDYGLNRLFANEHEKAITLTEINDHPESTPPSDPLSEPESLPDLKEQDGSVDSLPPSDPGKGIIDYAAQGLTQAGRTGTYAGTLIAGNFSALLGVSGLIAAAQATATAGLAVAGGMAAAGVGGTMVAGGTIKSMWDGKPVGEAVVDGLATPYKVLKKGFSLLSVFQKSSTSRTNLIEE